MRARVISNKSAGLITLSLVWIINILMVFTPRPRSNLPSFFFVTTTILEVVPKTTMCLIGKGPGLGFALMNLITYIAVFFNSIGERSDIVFSKEDHLQFLTSLIIQQSYSIILNSLLNLESRTSCELLETILKVVERKSQEKTNFISRMSHELRTPLHGMLSSVDLLKNTVLDEEQSTYLSAIDTCGALLLDTIVKILDISQIESGRFFNELTSFSLYSLIQNVVDPVSTLATKKNIDINVNFDFHPMGFDVHGDQIHLKEIILNVIYFIIIFILFSSTSFFFFLFTVFIYLFIYLFIDFILFF